MIKIISGLLCVFLFTSGAFSQDAFYRHYEGVVGTNIEIVVDIVKSGDRLNGYYYYFFDDESGDTSWTHYGKSMPVYGSTMGNQFEFSEFDPEVKGAVFEGTFVKDSIRGTWKSADGKKQLPIRLAHSYPKGSMPFTAYYMNKTGPLFKNKKEPNASIEITLLAPSEYSPANIADSVRIDIYDHFFDMKITSSSPQVLLDSMKELYFSNYRASNTDIYQEGSTSFDWQKKKEVRIIHNEKDILSVEFFDYGFTGGAHGLSLSNFHVFDLKDGHRIHLDEIFRADYRYDLRDIINAAARKKYGLDRYQPLTDAEFFDEFIEPTENFYITKDGIGFYYNQYEVAPFARGPVLIFINYNELLRILHKDSPVHKLISKK